MKITTIVSLLLVLSGPIPAFAQPAQDGARWSQTLDRVKTSVVSIRVDATRAYDGDWNTTTEATGFVVDAERGLILTNRHVVSPGPVVAEAVFINGEEAELTAVYRDPVHDFGFFRYDPEALQFIVPTALPLVPTGATVGTEIRVIGNDAGEKLSILSGTLAKLDRRAPTYSTRGYNDFNTFYIQSASGTSGGSSGSPVIDIDGRVVALNAGAANQAASSFFLPLNRVARALDKLTTNTAISRGSLQTTLVHQPFDELRRLGLSLDQERMVRSRGESGGMLVVERTIAESPVAAELRPGDILLSVDQQLVTAFPDLAESLDEAVGQMLTVTVQRGEEQLELDVPVTDLHAITPSSYLEYSGGVLHNLSYQQARNLNLPIRGVYVASPGYALAGAGINRGAIITEINNTPVNDIDQLAPLLAAIPDHETFALRHILAGDSRRTSVASVRADRRWFPANRCRNENGGDWRCTELPAPQRDARPDTVATIEFPPQRDPRLKALAPTLVGVRFNMPHRIAGASEVAYRGNGIVIDAEQGLVAVDRNTVPASLGDALLTFGGQVELAATVVGVHPTRNLTLLQYDPAALGDTPIRAIRLARKPAKAGDTVWLVSRNSDQQLTAHSTEISALRGLNPPLSQSFSFRETNLDAYTLINDAGVRSGVMVNARGQLLGLWTAYPRRRQDGSLRWIRYGMPTATFDTAVNWLRSGEPLRSLEVEFDQVPLFAARKQGLPERWLRQFVGSGDNPSTLLGVERILADAPAASFLRGGDLLLAINGQTVSSYDKLEQAVADEQLTMTVFRDGEERTITVPTVTLDRNEIDRVVVWAGAVFHEPHRAAREAGIESDGAYISYYSFGSPASRYGLFALQNVVGINDRPVTELNTLLEQISGLDDRQATRLRIRIWNGREFVKTLKTDHRYWPAYEFVRNDGQWQRRDIGDAAPLAELN